MASPSETPATIGAVQFNAEPRLVAFIDILGFGQEVRTADTTDRMRQAHNKIALIQQAFQKESAVQSPREQADKNRTYGRRVIALSDAVVIEFAPDPPNVAFHGEYDHWGMVIHDIVMAQAALILDHGVFIRGAVTHGFFHFENDILLSPALVDAYDLETRHAVQPIIVVPQATVDFIAQASERSGTYYSPESDVVQQLWTKYHGKRWHGQQLYFLDYFRTMRSEWLYPANTLQEQEKLRNAKTRYNKTHADRDAQMVDRILQSGYARSEIYTAIQHKEALLKAFKAALPGRVQKKYRWLIAYHNRSLQEAGRGFKPARIKQSELCYGG